VSVLEQVGNYWPVVFLVTPLSGEDRITLDAFLVIPLKFGRK
jgi:hypothetical protein